MNIGNSLKQRSLIEIILLQLQVCKTPSLSNDGHYEFPCRLTFDCERSLTSVSHSSRVKYLLPSESFQVDSDLNSDSSARPLSNR